MHLKEPTSKRTSYLLSRATEIAKSSSYFKYRHGAIITKGGRVLGSATNRMRVSDPNQCTNPKTESSIHAEIAALRACGSRDLKDAVLYVARVSKTGQQLMSKPCENCQKELKARGIKKVYYTVDSSMEL